MIAKLLHIANSDPPSNKLWRERFYAMKNRIVHRWAKPDGFDMQAFEGKVCWSCGGDGRYHKYSECYKCDGSGWYRSPRVIQLNRWRFGRFVFHEPTLTVYREAKPKDNISFRGRVEHAHYDYQYVLLATFLLAIFYDWGLARWAFGCWFRNSLVGYKLSRLRAIVSRKCIRCGRRVWSWRGNYCVGCCARVESLTADDDEEVPF